MLLRRAHDVAGLVRDGRTRLGWSQSDLADRVGVSRQWVSLVENEKTSVEFDLVVAALQALGYFVHVTTDEGGFPDSSRNTVDASTPTHGPSGRTRLTRAGEALGTQRTRRPPGQARQTDESGA